MIWYLASFCNFLVLLRANCFLGRPGLTCRADHNCMSGMKKSVPATLPQVMTLGDEIFQLLLQTGHNSSEQLLSTFYPFGLTLWRHDDVSFQFLLTYHTQLATIFWQWYTNIAAYEYQYCSTRMTFCVQVITSSGQDHSKMVKFVCSKCTVNGTKKKTDMVLDISCHRDWERWWWRGDMNLKLEESEANALSTELCQNTL